MRVFLTTDAERVITSLPRGDQQRIADKLAFFATQPMPLDYAKPLAGHHGFYRYRIASWRVVVEPRGELLIVHLVDRRKDIYRRLQ